MNNHNRSNILIVDDNPTNIEILGSVLMDTYEISVATSGQQAIDIMSSDVLPDLILLDIMMPEMDGYEVCNTLKTKPVTRDIPIIFVSAKSDDNDEAIGLEIGAVDYIKKPINSAITLERVKTQLELKRLRDELEIDLLTTQNDFRKQQVYFQQLFCNSPQAILFVDNKHQIVDVNERFCSVFGFPAIEMKGKETDFGIVPELKKSEHKTFCQSIIKGNNGTLETERKHKNGMTVPVSLFGYPVQIERDLEGYFVVYEDISQRKAFESQLKHQAFHDALTGIPNRLLFGERMSWALERSKRYREFRFAVLLIDLDRFKAVNDSLGHQVGDELLITISQRINDCIRSTDTVARLGGDEFSVLIEDFSDLREVTFITQRILMAIEKQVMISANEIYISASIGVVCNMEPYQNADEILRDADLAMYHAKDGGKANYSYFDAIMYEQVIESVKIEADLRNALEQNQLELEYQPIVSIHSNSIQGVEALVRWNHPQQGRIPPDRFIPVAEDTGLIVPIGQWILREACQQLKNWQAQIPTYSDFTINVNLSVKQFLQNNLVSYIKDLLDELELEPSSLKLELTESLIMEHSESALDKINKLRKMGIQFVIDDFGTGYSSLSYIHKFPVDVLKIDRSFVKRLETENDSLEIIRTIITMSQNLGLKVVAEGVENIQQLEILKKLSCHNAQGYLISKPLNKQDATLLLNKETVKDIAS